MGLDRGYRAATPAQLSGGQQQRVGVARGLAADPPVMLMDEPFGAVDPITRERLQDELLGSSGRSRKTIVCVTHDIDEAIKLGDRIAILREGGQVASTTRRRRSSRTRPTSSSSDFVGADRGLKRLALLRLARSSSAVQQRPSERLRAGVTTSAMRSR